jgi:hypothetical protein
MMLASWFRVEWRKKWVDLELKSEFGVFSRFWSGLYRFWNNSKTTTDRMRGNKMGFDYIRYACSWLRTQIDFKCLLRKSHMFELYNLGCLKGVWFWCVGKSHHFYTSVSQGADVVCDTRHGQGHLCNFVGRAPETVGWQKYFSIWFTKCSLNRTTWRTMDWPLVLQPGEDVGTTHWGLKPPQKIILLV